MKSKPKTVHEHLEELRAIKRKEHHPLIHEIHRTHRISRKTLFYVKEYGPHSHVARTIVKESIAVLLFASILSSFGGLALENIKGIFISLMPLVILLPAMNDMFGDYGAIASSRFSTMLHEGRINSRPWANPELRKLFAQVLVISLITAGLSAAVALAISGFSGFAVGSELAYKIFLIAIADSALLVTILFMVALLAGIYFYSKKEDPNNFLIPITTAIADFGNMLILSVLVVLVF